MNHPIQVSRPLWQRLAETIFEPAVLLAWYREQRRRARVHREFRALDAGTLRDLGVDGSEFASYEIESTGRVVRTRRRVAPRILRPSGL